MNSIFNWKLEDGISEVTINVEGETMNTLSAATLADFFNLMEELKKVEGLRGVIFISGKPNNFFAGANLNVLADTETEEQLREQIEPFHKIPALLNSLNCPSIAAIHGYCLGGGLEFALCCTARIAKEGKATMMGLPECNISLFPGGGGTQRLPRLIGYPAIELVMKGSMLNARAALEKGIIDRLVPADEDLLAAAKAFINGLIDGTESLNRPTHDLSKIDEEVEKARQEVLKSTRGREIPGHMLALDAMKRGLKISLEEGSLIEKENFIKAALSNEAKGSINTFFLKGLTDKPQAMMTKGFTPKPINKIAVIGFGTMGRGIIIDILRNTSIPVVVKDVAEAIEPGKAFVQKILEGMAAKNRLKEPVDSIMARLIPVSSYTDDFQDADLVIESVFEDIKVKQQVYEELSNVIKPDCLVASNTSMIPITTMANFISHPERFGGTHFFSPVWMMQLVEIVHGEKTSQETVDNLLNFAALIRKRPIVCKDNTGFVVNAMLSPYMGFAYQCVEEGTSIEDTDLAMVKFGMPVGVIRLTDEVGIDVPQKAFAAAKRQETLDAVVADGRLGLKKSGKGFFLKDGSVDPTVLPLIKKRPPVHRTEEDIQQGALEILVRVGKDLLNQKIVDDVRMIDVGFIWGTGFPADKGGPMKWADLTGLSMKLFGKNFY